MKSPTLYTIAALLSAPLTHATILLEESFDYTAGQTLATANSAWNQYEVATGSSNHIDTVATNLSVSGLSASAGGSINLTSSGSGNYRDFTAQTGNVYYSFALQVTAVTPFTTTGTLPFIGLNVSGTPGTRYAGVNMIYQSGTTYSLGINRTNSGGNTASGVTLNVGTTYFIVVGFSNSAVANGDSASIWINPSSDQFGGSPLAATATTVVGSSTASISAITINHTSGASNTPTFLIDELRVGQSWADVTPSGVPEPSSVALLAGGLILGATTVMRRRSRC